MYMIWKCVEQSSLSTYGSKSLGYTDKDIYSKQNSGFNIISLKAKDYTDEIRQYPKLSLENKDDYHYRRIVKHQEQGQRN